MGSGLCSSRRRASRIIAFPWIRNDCMHALRTVFSDVHPVQAGDGLPVSAPHAHLSHHSLRRCVGPRRQAVEIRDVPHLSMQLQHRTVLALQRMPLLLVQHEMLQAGTHAHLHDACCIASRNEIAVRVDRQPHHRLSQHVAREYFSYYSVG